MQPMLRVRLRVESLEGRLAPAVTVTELHPTPNETIFVVEGENNVPENIIALELPGNRLRLNDGIHTFDPTQINVLAFKTGIGHDNISISRSLSDKFFIAIQPDPDDIPSEGDTIHWIGSHRR